MLFTKYCHQFARTHAIIQCHVKSTGEQRYVTYILLARNFITCTLVQSTNGQSLTHSQMLHSFVYRSFWKAVKDWLVDCYWMNTGKT